MDPLQALAIKEEERRKKGTDAPDTQFQQRAAIKRRSMEQHYGALLSATSSNASKPKVQQAAKQHQPTQYAKTAYPRLIAPSPPKTAQYSRPTTAKPSRSPARLSATTVNGVHDNFSVHQSSDTVVPCHEYPYPPPSDQLPPRNPSPAWQTNWPMSDYFGNGAAPQVLPRPSPITGSNQMPSLAVFYETSPPTHSTLPPPTQTRNSIKPQAQSPISNQTVITSSRPTSALPDYEPRVCLPGDLFESTDSETGNNVPLAELTSNTFDSTDAEEDENIVLPELAENLPDNTNAENRDHLPIPKLSEDISVDVDTDNSSDIIGSWLPAELFDNTQTNIDEPLDQDGIEFPYDFSGPAFGELESDHLIQVI